VKTTEIIYSAEFGVFISKKEIKNIKISIRGIKPKQEMFY